MISPAEIALFAAKRKRGQKASRHLIAGANKRISKDPEFAFQCRVHRLPAMIPQYKITSPFLVTPVKQQAKTWSFDFAFPAYQVLVEIDGGIWTQGAHAHPTDIIRNMQKQNDAVLLGWHVLRFSTRDVSSGHAIAFTQRMLAARGWPGMEGRA